MSYMSLIEKRAKCSISISLLNKVRHWFQGRESISLTEKDREIIRESLDFDKKEQFSKAILYSLQAYGDKHRSVAFQIGNVFNAALNLISDDEIEQKKYIDSLKVSLGNDKLTDIDNTHIINGIELLTKAIHVIGEQVEPKTYQIIKGKVL